MFNFYYLLLFYANQDVGLVPEDLDFTELLDACLATSPNNSFDFLDNPDF
jgi:hypothetical protein